MTVNRRITTFDISTFLALKMNGLAVCLGPKLNGLFD